MTTLVIAFRNFATASKIQEEQNTSQNNAFQYSEESDT